MHRWRGKVAVVTGASAGIGLASAKSLVRQGMIVVGLARREDKMIREMENVEGPGKFYAKRCDVSKEREVIELFDYVRRTHESLSVLVNNAGMACIKSIEAADTAELEEVIGVNLMGLLYCSKHGIKLMKENSDEGHIVNVNSIAGHKVPHPSWFPSGDVNVNVYPATKFAVTALSEVLTNELLGNKIRVTNLSPGYVRSELMKRAFMRRSLMKSSLGKGGGQSGPPALKPEDVADAIAYVINAPSHVQITQLTIKPLGELY